MDRGNPPFLTPPRRVREAAGDPAADHRLFSLVDSPVGLLAWIYESHNSLDPELRVGVPSVITMYPRDTEKCPRPWAREVLAATAITNVW